MLCVFGWQIQIPCVLNRHAKLRSKHCLSSIVCVKNIRSIHFCNDCDLTIKLNLLPPSIDSALFVARSYRVLRFQGQFKCATGIKPERVH